MKTVMKGINVAGISVAVPKNELQLMSLGQQFGEKEVKRIMMSTGVESVRIAPESVKASDMCLAAAEGLIRKLHVDRSDIDAIVFVSQTPDYRMPATSAILQHRLGLNKKALAFDINYGCSAYIYGLFQASMLINAGGCSKVLVCAGDTITRFLDPNDQKVRLVFGDAGSATLVEKGNHSASFSIMTDGLGYDRLIIDKKDGQDDYLFMDGSAIMEFALREVPPIFNDVIQQLSWDKDDVGLVALHQANQFMVDYLRKKLKLPKEKVPVAVKHYGNTGPASIPLVLCHTVDQFSQSQKEKVVLSGFGVGLSWGAVGLSLENTAMLNVIEM